MCDQCETFEEDFEACVAGIYRLQVEINENSAHGCLNFSYQFVVDEACEVPDSEDECEINSNNGVYAVSLEVHPGWYDPDQCFPHGPEEPLHDESACELYQYNNGLLDVQSTSLEIVQQVSNKCTRHFSDTSVARCNFADFTFGTSNNQQNGPQNVAHNFTLHACFPGTSSDLGYGLGMLHIAQGTGNGNPCCSYCVPAPTCLGDSCL